jgi:type II secretory pathway component PulM
MMQLTNRERLLALGLGLGVGVWALYGLALRPATERIHTLQRIIPEKQVELRDLQAKGAQYTALRNESAQARTKLAAQEPDFELLPFLETAIKQHKLDKHVSRMEPDTVPSQSDYSETIVTIDLHDISLKQLIDFLSAVEASKSIVRVGTLNIRRNPKSEALLDSTVGICSPKLSQTALATHTAS